MDNKYHYNSWRPITAIREADTDANPARPQLRRLRYSLGTDDVSFTATSNKSGTTRTYHSLSGALQENINARVWAGIHFRTADLQGVKLGTTVARYLHHHDFQPAHQHHQHGH